MAVDSVSLSYSLLPFCLSPGWANMGPNMLDWTAGLGQLLVPLHLMSLISGLCDVPCPTWLIFSFILFSLSTHIGTEDEISVTGISDGKK